MLFQAVLAPQENIGRKKKEEIYVSIKGNKKCFKVLWKNIDIKLFLNIVQVTKIAHLGEKLMQQDEQASKPYAAKEACKNYLK